MPYKGLSWFRLKEHIRKYFAIYIVGCLVCGLLSNIIYTSTAPRIPYDEEVLLYLVDGYTYTAPLETMAADALAHVQTIDETLQTVHFESIMYNDPETDYNSNILLMARMALGDADVYFASATAADHISRAEAFLPLDEYLADGWLSEYNFPSYTHTMEETGETVTAGLCIDSLTGLSDLQAMYPEGAVLMIAVNTTNLETTMDTVDFVIKHLMEGTYAPAQSEEPAA